MNRRPAEEPTPDLFSTEQSGERSANQTSKATAAHYGRPILPRDLPKAIRYLSDREFDRLFQAIVDEAKRRRALPMNFKTAVTTTDVDTSRPTKTTPTKNERALTQGQVNAVRASFKAGSHRRALPDSLAYLNQMSGGLWPPKTPRRNLREFHSITIAVADTLLNWRSP
jgi:hypothetical protein